MISCSHPVPAGGFSAGLGRQGSQKSGKATRRNNIGINSAGRGPVQSDFGPYEDQDLLCLPRGCLGQRREQHPRADRWHRWLRGGGGDLLGGGGALASGADHAAPGRAGGDEDLDGISAPISSLIGSPAPRLLTTTLSQPVAVPTRAARWASPCNQSRPPPPSVALAATHKSLAQINKSPDGNVG